MQYFKLVQRAPEYGPASESPYLTLLRIVTLHVYKVRYHKVSISVMLFSSTISFIATV